MKLTDNYDLRVMAGEYVLMPQGDYLQNGKTPIIINEVSAYIVKEIKEEKSEDDILSDITNEYDVDKATALPEIKKILNVFRNSDIIY